jgi:hypothetical protein
MCRCMCVNVLLTDKLDCSTFCLHKFLLYTYVDVCLVCLMPNFEIYIGLIGLLIWYLNNAVDYIHVCSLFCTLIKFCATVNSEKKHTKNVEICITMPFMNLSKSNIFFSVVRCDGRIKLSFELDVASKFFLKIIIGRTVTSHLLH